ncbi:MAG TPA: TlpA disulfide reductase family protein [Chryseosolibacter sp.]
MKGVLRNIMVVLLASLPEGLSAQTPQPMLEQVAPTFTLNDLNGRSWSLEQMRGKITVIHFATTWCPFCNAEAPNLEQLYKDYRDKGVQVLIVDVMEDKELAEKSFRRFNFSFPVLLDADGKVSTSYAPENVQPDLARHEVPIASNLIVDKDGIIRFYSLLNTASFDAKLSQLKEKLNELQQSQ